MNVGRNDKCKAPNNMNILDDLKYRELIYQITDEKGLEKKLANGQIILYCGFDPSADSLHLGNLLQILILRRFQLAGHKPIALVGGATGLIGDPSGKKEERQLNLEEVVIEWGKKIKKQLEKFLDFDGDNKAEIVNNYDWLGKMTALNYLCDIGKNFSVNEMLAKESVKTRLGIGISFTEFNYMILQSIDFLELNKQTTRRDKFISHPDEYYRQLAQVLPEDNLKIWSALHHGRLLASALIIYFAGRSFFV